MLKIKKINPLSLAKILTVIYAVLGLFFGAFISALSLFGASKFPSNAVGPNFGLVSILIFPVLYAIIGFVAGIATAICFNLASGWLGGLEIEVETQKQG